MKTVAPAARAATTRLTTHTPVPVLAVQRPRQKNPLRRPLRHRWQPGPALLTLIAWWVLLALFQAPTLQAQRDRSLPGSDFTDSPVVQPPSVKQGLQDPSYGFQFGVGHPALSVQVKGVEKSLEPEGGFFDEGALMTVGFLLKSFRVGYALHAYRHGLSSGQVVEGQPVDFVSFEAHQLWIFHGFRPVRPLYFGYGLGLQSRTVKLYQNKTLRIEEADTDPVAGALLDYRFSPPFSLQLRWSQDLQKGRVQSKGPILQIAFYAPF